MEKHSRHTSTEEQFLSIIAELRAENVTLKRRIAELEAEVARLGKNSSNSSKPPSGDITKPPRPQGKRGKRRIGGQQRRSVFDFLHHAMYAYFCGIPPPSLLPDPL